MLSERLADYLDGNQEMFATQMAKYSQQPAWTFCRNCLNKNTRRLSGVYSKSAPRLWDAALFQLHTLLAKLCQTRIYGRSPGS